MKKFSILSVLLALIFVSAALRTETLKQEVTGNVLHTIQDGWVVIDETTSAGAEPPALIVGERTKLLLEAAIVTGASGAEEISTFVIPASWNGIRFRSVGITNNDAQTYQIYLGTRSSLESDSDCELSYAGQLVFTTGTQVSLFYQIAYTSGGPYVPLPGDTLTGNTSAETAVVLTTVSFTSGSFAAGDAAGTIQYRSKSGTFTNSETVASDRIARGSANVLTHAASDLVGFEMADAVVLTAKSWGSTWTITSPADDTNAEAELDIKGADFLVVLASEASHDVKLLGKGY
ncbi:hypothetical protein LCGC14_1343990 [marine sediment metagenome]|uniref:Uncharacterized protein n=1 Tax=marine sediment metagenome TaxID=412755 RepID=A0A0F9KCU8_9ZZZZ